jgi:hypothetical protein
MKSTLAPALGPGTSVDKVTPTSDKRQARASHVQGQTLGMAWFGMFDAPV